MSISKKWWQEAIFYHIYLRSFADSDGDGLGDLRGLIGKLDYLKGAPEALGIDAIWLSPFFPSPDKDFGYDVADYVNVDPRYGTLQDVDDLIKAAHARGIRIILDLVLNHTSDEHPWFLQSRSTPENAKSDWYIWREAKPNGQPPNNWQSVMGGKAWQWAPEREQYYLHLFHPGQPDLNWRNPAVREALWNVVQFWLDRGVDGFRLDVFNLWFKHEQLLDNPPRLGLRAFDRQHHIHDADQPEMHTALRQFRGLLDQAGERVSIGELFGRGPDKAASYCGDDQLHMLFNFEFMDSGWKPSAFQEAVLHWEEALTLEGWPAYVLSNHDITRAVTRYNRGDLDRTAKLLAVLLLTQRGTPFIYYGEEIGMPDLQLSRKQIMDPPGRKYWPFYKGRDACRGPMQWNASAHAGFSRAHPWLPVHPDFHARNLQAQQQDPYSVFHFYRRLINLRRAVPALHAGSFEPVQDHPRQGWMFLRRHLGGDALIGLNFRPRAFGASLPHSVLTHDWGLRISSSKHAQAEIAGKRMHLGPYEGAIWVQATTD